MTTPTMWKHHLSQLGYTVLCAVTLISFDLTSYPEQILPADCSKLPALSLVIIGLLMPFYAKITQTTFSPFILLQYYCIVFGLYKLLSNSDVIKPLKPLPELFPEPLPKSIELTEVFSYLYRLFLINLLAVITIGPIYHVYLIRIGVPEDHLGIFGSVFMTLQFLAGWLGKACVGVGKACVEVGKSVAEFVAESYEGIRKFVAGAGRPAVIGTVPLSTPEIILPPPYYLHQSDKRTSRELWPIEGTFN